MHLNSLSRIGQLLIAILVLGGALSATAPMSQLTEPKGQAYLHSPEDVSGLLKQIQNLAGELTRAATALESFTRANQVSWFSHADQLNLARDHINQMGKIVQRLHAIRHMAPACQQQAIQHFAPLITDVATGTPAAIEHVRDSPNHLSAPIYRGHVAAMYSRADEMRGFVDTLLEYVETEEKLAQLRIKLAGEFAF